MAWDPIRWAVLHEPTAATKRQIEGDGVIWNLMKIHVRIVARWPSGLVSSIEIDAPTSTDDPLGIRRHARASHKADLARTYLALHGETVAGYLRLTTGSVRPEDAPKRLSRRMRRYPIGTIAIDDDAVGFYRRWGFIDAPDNPRRRYRKMSDVHASLPR
jgi:hypothetical protein